MIKESNPSSVPDSVLHPVKVIRPSAEEGISDPSCICRRLALRYAFSFVYGFRQVDVVIGVPR